MHPILRDPRYWSLATAKARVSAVLITLALGGYLAFACGATWFPEALSEPLLSDANVGLFLALAVIVVSGGVAYIYSRVASLRFDPLEEALRNTPWPEDSKNAKGISSKGQIASKEGRRAHP